MSDAVLAVGLMSGTSADGVDVALLATDGEQEINFLAGKSLPYEPALRERLLAAAQDDVVALPELMRLEREVTRVHAAAFRQLFAESEPPGDIAVVGFHGHTVRHLAAECLTWQLGDPSYLAEELDIRVVGDFRRRDLAAGGEGAPLAALFHQALLSGVAKPCVVLNLGGVGNITWLGEGGAIVAGDTGPGCGLLDAWVAETAGVPFDEGGKLASAGRIHDDRVRVALAAPFFEKQLPKSADRFEFDDLIDLDGLNPADGAATLCALSADAVALAAEELPAPPRAVWVTGGGANHPRIMQRLTERFAPLGVTVGNVAELGLRSATLEAECFAWLAVRRLRGLGTTLPETTGCRHATVGGVLTA